MSVQQPRPHQSVRPRSWGWHWLRYVLLVAALFIGWSALTGPSSADIRLDAGDLRYRYAGIPIYRDRMPEPQRRKLLELARRSPVLKGEWCWLAPQRTSNDPALMCRGFYYRIAAWADEDPAMAATIAEDVARYIQRTHASEGLPDTFPLLMCAQRERDDEPVIVRSEWRDDPHVRQYFARIGQAP